MNISKDGKFILPRRFTECWQFLTEYPGTINQQDAVRAAYEVSYASQNHRFMKRLDQNINTIYQRSFFTFGFVPTEWFSGDQVAIAGRVGINLSENISPAVAGDIALHELFHVADMQFLTAATKLQFMVLQGIDPNINTWNHNVQETWADAGRDWWRGHRSDLTPLLLG